MKCIKYISNGSISRLSDSLAALTVSCGQATYCPKSEWKETRRGAAAARAEEKTVEAPEPTKPDRGKWNKKTKKYEKPQHLNNITGEDSPSLQRPN